MERCSVFSSRNCRRARRITITVACGLSWAVVLTAVGGGAPAKTEASKAKDERVERDGGGRTINEGQAERRAGQGYHSGTSATPRSCSGVDLVVKRVTMDRTGATGVAVSATMANRCTGETDASADWSAKTNADDSTVYQHCVGPGVGEGSWVTGTLVLPGLPLDQTVVATVTIDPRNTIRETNNRNNTCRAVLSAGVDRRVYTCR
jgi:hypothetical protein